MDPETEALLDLLDKHVAQARKQVKRVLNFSVIQGDWDSLLQGMTLKLEREFPAEAASNGAREFLWFTFRVALNTYRSMAYICGDKPADPLRKLEYAVSCPPLVRTLVDSLFNVIFALEDLENRVTWYYKSGWREDYEKLERYMSEYGSAPEWKSWLETDRATLEHGIKVWGITDEEAKNFKKMIDWWPTPARMIRHGLKPSDPLPDDRAFLEFLNDWYYRELSQESHLSYPGLAHRGGLLWALDRKEERAEEHLIQNKSTQMIMAVTLLLALCSEIEHRFNFGFKQRIVVLWAILNELPVPKEMYDKRYAKLLP
jgi:hypothetical protein